MNLTEYLLTCLSEEGAEIVQIACKSQRFGLDDIYDSPEKNPLRLTNRQRLIGELNDFMAIVRLMQERGLIGDWASVYDPRLQSNKREKWEKYLSYSQSVGALTDHENQKQEPSQNPAGNPPIVCRQES